MVAASISMSDEQWNRCVETRKRKWGDVENLGDGEEADENLEIAVTESQDTEVITMEQQPNDDTI